MAGPEGSGGESFESHRHFGVELESCCDEVLFEVPGIGSMTGKSRRSRKLKAFVEGRKKVTQPKRSRKHKTCCGSFVF